MKKLLLATTALLMMSSAQATADTIIATARVDGVLVTTDSSPDGSLNIVNQSFGPIFSLNSLTLNSQEFLAGPGILSTNTFDVQKNIAGAHQLVLDIKAFGLVGPNALTSLLSTFSVSGLPAGWTIMEQTLINGSLLSTTPLFSGVSDSASEIKSAFLGNTFNAEAIYTINSTGLGNVNGGVDISVAAVPEIGTWAMLIIGFAGISLASMRRKISNNLRWA